MSNDITPLRPPRLASGPLAVAAKICWSSAQMIRHVQAAMFHTREACIHQLCNAALATKHDRIRRIAEDALKAAAAGGRA